MSRQLFINRMMQELESEQILTWFDLGSLTDRLRDKPTTLPIQFAGDFEGLKKKIRKKKQTSQKKSNKKTKWKQR